MIVNLMSVIPFLGPSLCILIWGGYTVNLYTVKRFFTFHFLLPLVVTVLVGGHLLLLHFFGSNSHLMGGQRQSFFGTFLVKDALSWALRMRFFGFLLSCEINLLGDVENFLCANPVVTPMHIKPEWYFLFAYSILRCIPNKTLRVVALLVSVAIYIFWVVRESSRWASNFFGFLVFYLLLTITGAMPVEAPYVLCAQILSLRYFLLPLF